jgi:uncharacterized integral membrane protein
MIAENSTRMAAVLAVLLGVTLWAAARAIAAEESTAASRTADGAPASIAALTQVPDEVIDAANSSSNSAHTGESRAGSSALPPELDVPGADTSDDPNSVSEPRVEYPSDMPSWITQPVAADGPVHYLLVESDPALNVNECRRGLDEKLEAAVNEYIDDYLSVAGASRLVSYDAETIRTRLVRPTEQYTSRIKIRSLDPMLQSWARLSIDQDFRNELDERWRAERRKARLLQTVLFGGGAMAVLALVFGFFSIDTATRGYYTGRLRLAALTAILAVIVAGVLVARFVPWL